MTESTTIVPRPSLGRHVLLFTIWASALLSGTAVAAECRQVVTTVATGFGVATESIDEQENSAVLDALASAVAQVRGVFVDRRTELVDVYSSMVGGGGSRATATTDFSDSIRTRSSGLVVGYQLLDSWIDRGVLNVELSVGVCKDPRLVVDWYGPARTRFVFEEAFRQVLVPTGWAVISADDVWGRNIEEASLASGATHIVRAELRTEDRGRWEGMERVDSTLTVSLRDVLGNELLRGSSRTGQAVGRTLDEATNAGLSELARTAAGDVVRALAGDAPTTTMTITFNNIRRANTPVELRGELQGVPGVVSVTQGVIGEGMVVFEVAGSLDACSLSAKVARTRRMLLREIACSATRASLDVLRE